MDKDAAARSAHRIAGDPSASEKQWMAACTVIDGKKLAVGNLAAGPAWLGLPWSMCVSGLSGLGGFVLFVSLCAGVAEALTAVTGVYQSFNGATGFIVLGSAFVTFSTVFSYQKHLWKGGKIWSVVHWSAVGLCALLPLVVGSLDFFPVPPLDLLTMFSAWALGFIGLSAVASTLANRNIKALECSIGAQRVIPYSRAIYSIAGLCLVSMIAAQMLGFHFNYSMLVTPIVLLGTGYYVAFRNRAANPATATVLGLSVWNPMILCNLFLLPALVLHSAASLFTSLFQVGIFDYGVCLTSMALLIAGPTLGALAASKGVQRENELELHSISGLASLQAVPIQAAPSKSLDEKTA